MRRVVALCGAMAVVWLGACDAAPPAAERCPQTQPTPAERPAQPAPTIRAPLAETRPATRPAATEPVDVEVEPPEYVTILERFRAGERATVRVRTAAGNQLVVETRNVRRLRIERAQVPLERGRSISLQLDGQGIEWLAKSTVTEFERAENGYWTSAKEAAARRPQKK